MPQASSKGVKRRAADAASKQPVRKRPAAARTHTASDSASSKASKCRSIVAAVSGAQELPRNVREMLATLAKQSMSESPHPYQEAAMGVLGDALRDIESRLSSDLREVQAVVSNADTELVARFQALHDAEVYLAEQKQTIFESKKAIKDASKAVYTAKETLQEAHAEQKNAEGEKKALEAKKVRLESIEKEAYSPLKEASASGQDGQKKLSVLRKAAKDFSFNDILLSILPAVLKKVPDRRATFDSLAMQQLEVEFMSKAETLEASLTEKDTLSKECSRVVQAAQSALNVALDWHDASKAILADAEANLISGKEEVRAAQQRARKHELEIEKATRDADRIVSQLTSFRQGPLAAFNEMRKPSQVASRKMELCELATSGSFQYPLTEIHRRMQRAAQESESLHDLDPIGTGFEESLPLTVPDVANSPTTGAAHAEALPEPTGLPRAFCPC